MNAFTIDNNALYLCLRHKPYISEEMCETIKCFFHREGYNYVDVVSGDNSQESFTSTYNISIGKPYKMPDTTKPIACPNKTPKEVRNMDDVLDAVYDAPWRDAKGRFARKQ